MIKEFVRCWDKNKDALREEIVQHLKETEYYFCDYSSLFKLLLEKVLVVNDSPFFNSNRLKVIDDGDYQGTEIFIVPRNIYQPSAYDYVFTECFYGSCSFCDTLLSVLERRNIDAIADGLMQICLNMVQSLKILDGQEYAYWLEELDDE